MYELDQEQLALQAQARELAQSEFAPLAAEVDRTEAYPWASIDKLRDAGFMGMTLPPELGGKGRSYQDRKSTRLNSSYSSVSRMPSSA